MPPVAQTAVAFAAGLWVGRALSPSWILLALPLAAAVGLRRPAPWGMVLLVILVVGGAHGRWLADRERASCSSQWTAGRRAAIVRLLDAPSERGVADAVVRHAAGGCDGRLRLRLRPGAAASGATLVVVGAFAPGGALRVEHARVLGARQPLRFAVRDAVARRIDRLFGARAPLIEALVLGRRGDVDPRLRAEFVASGLAHLLAISGLHVGIVGAWLTLLGRAAGLGRRALWVGATGVWLYAFLLGFPPPATRAAGFVAIAAVARARQRHPPPAAVLAVAVLLVLAIDPAAVTQAGAWLSVAAVWGTAEAAALLRRGRKRGALVELATSSAGAVLATAPITAYVFGQVALAGLATNLVALPLAGVIVPGVLASLVAGPILAAGTGLALAALERIASVGARLPFGVVAGDPGVAFTLPWAAALAVAVWLVRRRPTWPVVARRALLAMALVSWAAAARDWWTRDRYSGFTMHVLAVGQGDAIALRSPSGRWALVDAGPRTRRVDAGRSVVAPFLRRQGVRTLDFVVVSHGDADHLGGVPSVLAAVPAGLVLEPGQPLGTDLYGEYLRAVDAAGASWRAARDGDVLEWDGVRIEVLHPSAAWVRREARPNENSVVLRVSYGEFDALLSGDAGLPVESLLVDRLPRVELLKVGHHGSAGSSGTPWLTALGPRVAVISVGANGYGHPAPDVLARLAERGVTVFRTDRGGTVTVRTDGRYLEVTRGEASLLGGIACRVHDRWSRSRASSSSRSACSPRPPGSSPTSFTTWPSPPR
jgi:competence protein ComEC